LRGESRRIAQLPDLVPLPNEGPTPCEALILIMWKWKVNKHHKVEYMGVLRNKDVLFCPLSALGFYFFWRWGYVVTGSHPGKQSVPCRPSSSPATITTCAPSHINYREREWVYEGQREWVDRLFVGAGIQSSKKMHATRKQAARDAEVEGVKEAQIRTTPCRLPDLAPPQVHARPPDLRR
jgi:centromere DNA-binding complex CBF3 subunit-like protein